MPRRKRSYLPGCAFHITARTHSGEFWFDGLQSRISEIIDKALKQTDAVLLAHAIMTNHLHLVIRQGDAPLGRLMQPIGQRTAYAVHRHWKRSGYVFGYRYFETACKDEAHLRNAIMYTHRNPVEAGLCMEAADYEWSSARAYSSSGAARLPALQPALKIFASGLPDRTLEQEYSDFYSWYNTCKQLAPGAPHPHSPGVTEGDVFWMLNFGSLSSIRERPRTDLRDIALLTIAESQHNVTLEMLRMKSKSPILVAIRGSIIERAVRTNHRTTDIATFLNLSDTSVSRVRTRSVLTETP